MIAVFLFFNESFGFQSRFTFSDRQKHCAVLTNHDASEHWLYFERMQCGIVTRYIKTKDGLKLINRLKSIQKLMDILVVDVIDRPDKRWVPIGIQSCNALCQQLTSLDIGFTFNPRHLYNKIIRYNGKRNYELLLQWRR